jgi:hypothetical protein
MRTKLVAWILICLAGWAPSALAQTDRGTITGTVLDPAGAVIAGAQLEARNTATGAVYAAASSATGNYSIPQLPAGTYELSVTMPGFKKYVRTDIVITVASTVRVDPQLEVGAATESVTVTAEAAQLKTESGELSHNVSSNRLNQVPVIQLSGGAGLGNIRNPLNAVTLLPGASFANDNTLRINGMPSSSQAIRIEGQDATNGLWRQLNQSVQPGLDAIEEVSVQTSNYAAEFGQAGGGYFNFTMKSGTNQFHGSAYDYFVNEFLNAGTPFTSRPEGGNIRNKQRRNDFGATLGGPIWIPGLYNGRDRSFFFLNFEQFRETQNIATAVQTVPTPAYRAGDFSGALLGRLTIGGQPASDALGNPVFQNQVFDPRSTVAAPDGSLVRLAYPGNRVPVADMDPVALRIQNLMPLPLGPNANTPFNNYAVPAYSNYRRSTIPSFKLDHNFSSKIKASAYYSENYQVSPNANGFATDWTSAARQDQVSRTTRLNYDHTLTPTTLLHLGAGLLLLHVPSMPPDFDVSRLGWRGNFYTNKFPNIGGLSAGALGGSTLPLGSGFMYEYSRDIKPTGNAYVNMVRNNHTIKFGGEFVVEGIVTRNLSRANGIFGFAAQQSGNPWEEGRGTNAFTGFPYASFLLGRTNSLLLARVSDTRLGNHAMGFYAQDTWKITRKLTLDYGLRYDFVTLLREQYGRMPSAAFNLPNPAAAGRLGTVIYEATCGCRFNKNYPHAWGPRLGMAYQIDSKTVLRAGFGISYGTAPNNAFLSLSVADFYTFSTPGYGQAATELIDGNPYAPGNRFGNPEIVWPDFSPHYPNLQAPGFRPPQGVFISIDRHAGKPPRIAQWSVSLQREIVRNLVAEVSYVGNRGAYWTAPLLQDMNYNALRPEFLARQYGLDMSVAADRNLLTTQLRLPNGAFNPAITARFPGLANVNAVYPGFFNPAVASSSQTLGQALRPYPHWLGIPPFLGPPLGRNWYDALQATLTKRYSHGLDLGAAFTWQQELINGTGSDTSYLTPNPPLINDVFNRRQQKQISGFSRPLMFVVNFNYTTPGFTASAMGGRALSWLVRDWTFGGVLRYQSGALIRVPASNNGFFTQLRRTDNPAIWGGANTFWNRVPDQPLFLADPNCKCFDPTRQLVLNPAAWTDAAPGTFGTSAPYYHKYRWQRQPSESLSVGRIFRIVPDRNMTLQIRAEFFNVFNRLFLSSPTATNPAAPTACQGVSGVCPTTNGAAAAPITSGFGWVNTVNGAGTNPRSGQMVARFTF